MSHPDLTPLQQLQVRAAGDPDLRARALADPSAVLAEFGLGVAAGHTITAVEVPAAALADGTAAVPADDHVLVLPVLDEDAALSEDELGDAAGGWINLVIAGGVVAYYAGLSAYIKRDINGQPADF
jgi:hypothetical protein